MERLEGHGVERVLPSGLVLPATNEAKARTKNDTFRARVVAISRDADRFFGGQLRPGAEILVYTFSGKDNIYTGERTPYGLFIEPEDVLCGVAEGADVEVLRKDLSGAFSFSIERAKKVSKKKSEAA